MSKYSVVSKDLFNINYPNDKAKIAIVGISPGSAQINKNHDINSLRERNKICAFANREDNNGKPRTFGTRTNLIYLLNLIGLKNFIDDDDCKSLWEDGEKGHFDDVLFTSLLPYAVIKVDDGVEDIIETEQRLKQLENIHKQMNRNSIDGFYISKISYNQIFRNSNPVIEKNFEEFKKTISKSKKSLKIIIALGKAYDVLIEAIHKKKIELDEEIIVKIPHASTSNNSQINAFAMYPQTMNKMNKIQLK